MKSTPLLIHELELEIQGVSVNWVQEYQELITTKLIQIFNKFKKIGDSSLVIDYVEIDIGKYNNIEDFLLFLDIELVRWNRQLLVQKEQLTDITETNNYYEVIQNDWDTIFKETKDFFNPDISSNSENIRIKFLEISELLQRNPEQFWRWFKSFGISEELVVKFRKFLYSHLLPNEAVVAWATSMLVIKDKKPAESYEQILSQILLKNFKKSTKFSIILKRNEDEFIQYLNKSNDADAISNQNKIIDFSEADWNSIEAIIPWDDLLSNNEFTQDIIHKIPLTYLLKLLKSSYWIKKNTLWENLSVYLLINNIVSQDELQTAISMNQTKDIVYSIHQWLKNNLPLNQISKQITQIFYLLLTEVHYKTEQTYQLHSILKTLDLEINQEENQMLLEYWEDLVADISSSTITIQDLLIKIQQLITLSINLSDKTRIRSINILDILKEIEPNVNIKTESNNIDDKIDPPVSGEHKNFIQVTEEERKIKDFLELIKRFYQPLLLLFNSTDTIVKLLQEINNKIENYPITSQEELSSFINQILKTEQTTHITDSIDYLLKKFASESEGKQELILWIEWLAYLSGKTNNTAKNPFEIWKSNSNNDQFELKGYIEELNSEVLTIAKSEIKRVEANSNNHEEIFSEAEIRWFTSFLENIEKETIQYTNQLSENALDLYFSYFNLSIITDINQTIVSFQYEDNLETEISNGGKNQDSRINKIRKKLTLSVITDLIIQYNNYYTLNRNNLESNTLDEINIFQSKLETIEKTPFYSIKTNQQLTELIAQLLLKSDDSQITIPSDFQPNELIFSTFKIFDLWLNTIQTFTNSMIDLSTELEESVHSLDSRAPILSEVIKDLINDSQVLDQKIVENYISIINPSIKTIFSYLKKLDYLLQEISRSSSNGIDSKLNQFYRLNINALISGLFNKIKIENHIGSTIKLNYLIQNFLEGTAALMNEIIHSHVFNEAESLHLLESFLNSNNRLPKNIQVSFSNYQFITLLETNYLFQTQIPEIISEINNQIKSALITPNGNPPNSIEQKNLKNVIFNNPNQISINSPINTWTNNIESTFDFDEILTNINVFINIIQNPNKISIITTETGSKTSIRKNFSKIEFINILFGHPKWRELYVQLTRNGGSGFKKITDQLTLLETLQVIGNKFPTSNTYNSEIKQLISDVITSNNYSTDFLQTFKFFWIQQTTPPSPLRTLQILLDSYFTLGQNNILEIIQSTIIPSPIFKRLTRLEKKELDEWIGNQFKKSSTTNARETEKNNTLLNHFSSAINRIPIDHFIQITSNESESEIQNVNESKINQAKEIISSETEPSSNNPNLTKSNLSDDLTEPVVNNQIIRENSIKTDPNNILIFLGDSFINNTNDWNSLIVEIKRQLIINHTISEKTIAEQLYFLIEKKLPKNHDHHQLQGVFKSMISLSIWFEILDQLPPKTYHRFSNFTNSQQAEAINLIRQSKNNFSTEQKVIFLNNLISDYLIFKSNHWLFSESFNSISDAIIEIRKRKPIIFKSVISKIMKINGSLDRHWNLPLFETNPIVNYKESNDSLKSAVPLQNEKSAPIFFPIIEKSWSIWQRNNLFNNDNNSPLINIIIKNYLSDFSVKPANLFSWLDKILSISYLNNNSLFADLTFNKILIREWFLKGNITLDEINTHQSDKSSIIQNTLNQVFTETKLQNVDLNFFSLLNDIIKFSDKKTNEKINNNFKIFHQYLDSIQKEIRLVDSNLTRLKLINDADLMEIYNLNLLKFFLSIKQRSADWISYKDKTLNSKENIETIINALIQSQTINTSVEREIAINYLQKIQQILNEILIKKSESSIPVYWEISTQLILNAFVDISIDLIDLTELSGLKSQIIQNRTVAIKDLFDRELLKESIKENVVASLNAIESTFNQTSNIEFSLILYWLTENINFQLDDFNIQENPILSTFYEKSSQLPETDHITDLIIQPLMLLNYESGLSTNDYFKETLIPILLLTATYNKSKQISNILDSYNIESSIPAGQSIDPNKVDINKESPTKTESISTERDDSTIENSTQTEHITVAEDKSINDKISAAQDIKTPEKQATGEGIKSKDGDDTTNIEASKSADDPKAMEDHILSDGIATAESISTVENITTEKGIRTEERIATEESISTKENITIEEGIAREERVTTEEGISREEGKSATAEISEKSATDITATNKTPLIQLPYSIDSILQQLFNEEKVNTSQLRNTLEELLKTIPNSEVDKIVSKIKDIWEKQIKPIHIIEGHIQEPELFKAIEGIPSVKKIEIKKSEERKQDNASIKKAVNQGTRFATGLCGMIMLAPYYGTLFRRMNLIENNNFISELEQLKAYSIIFHIAKLHEETPTDYQDLVPRIIVGIPPEASVSGILQLNAEELEEIEKFLTAVKSQWKLMNNVTLRGFIQSFLLRTGKVWKEGDKWKIEVDTHGADIILKTVPWGFSFIKYPWNPYIIETKWELD